MAQPFLTLNRDHLKGKLHESSKENKSKRYTHITKTVLSAVFYHKVPIVATLGTFNTRSI